MATVLTPAEIKQKITDWITTNGQGDITGAHLNTILAAIMDYVGVGYALRGTAPASAPSPDVPSAYLAAPGTYTNYESGDTVIPEGSIAVLKYDGSAWSKSVIKVCEPVSVSQNIETGGYNIQVGSNPPVNIASMAELLTTGHYVEIYNSSPSAISITYAFAAGTFSVVFNNVRCTLYKGNNFLINGTYSFTISEVGYYPVFYYDTTDNSFHFVNYTVWASMNKDNKFIVFRGDLNNACFVFGNSCAYTRNGQKYNVPGENTDIIVNALGTSTEKVINQKFITDVFKNIGIPSAVYATGGMFEFKKVTENNTTNVVVTVPTGRVIKKNGSIPTISATTLTDINYNIGFIYLDSSNDIQIASYDTFARLVTNNNQLGINIICVFSFDTNRAYFASPVKYKFNSTTWSEFNNKYIDDYKSLIDHSTDRVHYLLESDGSYGYRENGDVTASAIISLKKGHYYKFMDVRPTAIYTYHAYDYKAGSITPSINTPFIADQPFIRLYWQTSLGQPTLYECQNNSPSYTIIEDPVFNGRAEIELVKEISPYVNSNLPNTIFKLNSVTGINKFHLAFAENFLNVSNDNILSMEGIGLHIYSEVNIPSQTPFCHYGTDATLFIKYRDGISSIATKHIYQDIFSKNIFSIRCTYAGTVAENGVVTITAPIATALQGCYITITDSAIVIFNSSDVAIYTYLYSNYDNVAEMLAAMKEQLNANGFDVVIYNSYVEFSDIKTTPKVLLSRSLTEYPYSSQTPSGVTYWDSYPFFVKTKGNDYEHTIEVRVKRNETDFLIDEIDVNIDGLSFIESSPYGELPDYPYGYLYSTNGTVINYENDMIYRKPPFQSISMYHEVVDTDVDTGSSSYTSTLRLRWILSELRDYGVKAIGFDDLVKFIRDTKSEGKNVCLFFDDVRTNIWKDENIRHIFEEFDAKPSLALLIEYYNLDDDTPDGTGSYFSPEEMQEYLRNGWGLASHGAVENINVLGYLQLKTIWERVRATWKRWYNLELTNYVPHVIGPTVEQIEYMFSIGIENIANSLEEPNAEQMHSNLPMVMSRHFAGAGPDSLNKQELITYLNKYAKDY